MAQESKAEVYVQLTHRLSIRPVASHPQINPVAHACSPSYSCPIQSTELIFLLPYICRRPSPPQAWRTVLVSHCWGRFTQASIHYYIVHACIWEVYMIWSWAGKAAAGILLYSGSGRICFVHAPGSVGGSSAASHSDSTPSVHSTRLPMLQLDLRRSTAAISLSTTDPCT
jgi:hypothetical protein